MFINNDLKSSTSIKTVEHGQGFKSQGVHEPIIYEYNKSLKATAKCIKCTVYGCRISDSTSGFPNVWILQVQALKCSKHL